MPEKNEQRSGEEADGGFIHTGSKEMAARFSGYNDSQNTKITIEQHKGVPKYR